MDSLAATGEFLASLNSPRSAVQEPMLPAIEALIDRIRDRDFGEYEEIWQTVEEMVKPVLVGIGRFVNRPDQDIEAWNNDFHQRLLLQQLRPLRSFRGNTTQELEAFLRTICRRWLFRVLQRGNRFRQLENSAILGWIGTGLAGPSEPDLIFRLEELRTQLSLKENLQLSFFLGEYKQRRTPCKRTTQLWRKSLLLKCGILLKAVDTKAKKTKK